MLIKISSTSDMNAAIEARHQIAKWLLQEATAYRSKGRISVRKIYKKEQMLIADALEAAGKFVLALRIECK